MMRRKQTRYERVTPFGIGSKKQISELAKKVCHEIRKANEVWEIETRWDKDVQKKTITFVITPEDAVSRNALIQSSIIDIKK
jgi:hypothetical protein